mmetsp:Transcript_99536/g.315958  ORF Transcript_99536/g.315958 Transcript_99536/m.315958 type:complete len:204 (-) Transcript_99536:327-938(-)
MLRLRRRFLLVRRRTPGNPLGEPLTVEPQHTGAIKVGGRLLQDLRGLCDGLCDPGVRLLPLVVRRLRASPGQFLGFGRRHPWAVATLFVDLFCADPAGLLLELPSVNPSAPRTRAPQQLVAQAPRVALQSPHQRACGEEAQRLLGLHALLGRDSDSTRLTTADDLPDSTRFPQKDRARLVLTHPRIPALVAVPLAVVCQLPAR